MHAWKIIKEGGEIVNFFLSDFELCIIIAYTCTYNYLQELDVLLKNSALSIFTFTEVILSTKVIYNVNNLKS